jgi:hypothetical protein
MLQQHRNFWRRPVFKVAESRTNQNCLRRLIFKVLVLGSLGDVSEHLCVCVRVDAASLKAKRSIVFPFLRIATLQSSVRMFLRFTRRPPPKEKKV